MISLRHLLFAASVLSLTIATTDIAQAQTAPVTAPPASLVQKPAPAGAPNVLLIVLDDVGFGAASTFGGAAQTPALDALAHDGLRFNRFHTTAICSPTRSSLLTGRNPHATGIGAVMNAADSRPGYSGYHGKDTATIAEILRENGYNTAAFGKWHQTPDWEVGPTGPFDRWPTGEGFESFYGFQGGETNEFDPTLYDGTKPILRPDKKNYHLSEDLADHSITWLKTQHSVAPGKPFFLYLATGGIHAPVQVPQEWIDKYKGKFDQGWDKLREEIFEREKKLGVIPADTKLTPRPAELPAWDSLSPEEKKFSSHLMEAYAAYLAHTDAQVGKVIQSLKDSGQYDNTLIIYLVGDNGASLEGSPEGSLNYLAQLYGFPQQEAAKLARIDEIGSEKAYAHVNSAWAWATNSPFPWGKAMAGHLGGIRNPLVISWPDGIKDKGGLRSQFGHVNDIVPTILDIVGIAAPASVNGIAQKPINGTSLRYTFDDAKAPERHTTQYFEVFGRRSIYHDGWFAMANHGALPWQVNLKDTPPADDKWELYDLRKDFSESTNLAAAQPAKLAELEKIFDQEAAANNVLPISGMRYANRGLPDPSAGVTHATYYPGARGIPEASLPKTANHSWTISAKIEATAGAHGVVAAVGGNNAGWSLYLDQDRHVVFRYRLFDVQTVELKTADALPVGAHDIAVDFAYAGPGFAKGGALDLKIDGQSAAKGQLYASNPALFSIDETFDVGIDRGSPSGIYPAHAPLGFAFSEGDIKQVDIDIKP